MRFRSVANVAAVGLLALGCGSSAEGDYGVGGSLAVGVAGGGSGGTPSGGRSAAAGGTGGASSANGGVSNEGGMNATGGGAGSSAGMGTAGGMGPGAGAGGMDMTSAGGFSSGASGMGDGGMGTSGRGNGRGGRGAGGIGAGGMSTAGMGAAGMGTAGSGATGCPASGNVTYTLTKAASPTADQQKAYDLITQAMDKALEYYNCYTNITKQETVTYNPSVETADGNSNGSIRFGGMQYMEYSRAMHEIAHTVGIGTYQEFHDLTVDGIFTGELATAQVRINTGDPSEVVHADANHFWPGGLNYASEAGSEKDVIDHCLMVVAIRADMGFD